MTRSGWRVVFAWSLLLVGCSSGEDPAVQKAREQLPPNFKLTMGGDGTEEQPAAPPADATGAAAKE